MTEQFEVFIRSFFETNYVVELPFSGTSMLPTIPKDCCILAQKVSEIKVGDIYIFLEFDVDCMQTKLVCHRLVARRNDEFVFKGDNRNVCDKPVKLNDILGQLISIVEKRE